MQNMTTFLAGHPFERIPQIDPDEIRTMEDVVAALRIIHDELSVKDPVALLIKKELKLFSQVLAKLSSSYQTVKLFVLVGLSQGDQRPGVPEYEIDDLAGRVGSLSYLFSAHAAWEISQENKGEIVVLTAAAQKIRSILAQVSKNPMQYMCNLFKTAANYQPKVKTFIDYTMRDFIDNIYIPAIDGAKVFLPHRLEFFDAVQDFNPDHEPSEARVIEALNNLVVVLDTCCLHLNIRKEERPWVTDADEAARFGDHVSEYRAWRIRQEIEDSSKDAADLSKDMSHCAKIDDPILQKFMSNVLINVTLCLSLKLLFNKNKEYAFSGLLLEHVNLAIDIVNENHTVQGKERQYNVPTQHGEYRTWLEKSNLPLLDNKDLKRWEGVEVGRGIKQNVQ